MKESMYVESFYGSLSLRNRNEKHVCLLYGESMLSFLIRATEYATARAIHIERTSAVFADIPEAPGEWKRLSVDVRHRSPDKNDRSYLVFYYFRPNGPYLMITKFHQDDPWSVHTMKGITAHHKIDIKGAAKLQETVHEAIWRMGVRRYL